MDKAVVKRVIRKLAKMDITKESPIPPVVKKVIRKITIVKPAVQTTRKHVKSVSNPVRKQKYPTPSSQDPLYRFYTTLLKQRPDSEMAQKWCQDRGIVLKNKQ